MRVLHDPPSTSDLPPVGAEVLIPEARRLRRRRWSIAVGVSLLVGLAVGIAVGTTGGTAPVQRTGTQTNLAIRPTAVGLIGIAPKSPGALAVGPNSDLYLVDSGRDQILRRLSDGKFQVVAGTGRRGFSGDGAPAIDAMLNLEGDAGLAVAKDGTVYFSDSGNERVREVLPDGIVKTVVGGGTTPLGSAPLLARDAKLASGLAVAGLTIAPDNDLYLALPDGVYRLTAAGMLVHVVGGGSFDPKGFRGVYTNPAISADFSPAYRLAFDRAGDLFVAGGGGWGLYERTEAGALRFVEILRGDGAGFFGSLATDPNGSVIAVSNVGIQESTSGGLMASLTSNPSALSSALDRALGRLPHPAPTGVDTNTFRGGVGVAVAPNGTIYVDTDSGVWSRVNGILAVTSTGHVTTLWKS